MGICIVTEGQLLTFILNLLFLFFENIDIKHKVRKKREKKATGKKNILYNQKLVLWITGSIVFCIVDNIATITIIYLFLNASFNNIVFNIKMEDIVLNVFK